MEEQTTIQPSPESVSQDSPQVIPPIDTPEVPKSRSKKWLIVVFGLIFFLVFVIVSLLVLLTSTVRELSVCLEENSMEMQLLFQRGIVEQWDNHQKCVEIQPVNEELISCCKKVESSSFLPAKLAFILGGLIKPSVKNVDKDSIVRQHNTNCIQYPDTLIGN